MTRIFAYSSSGDILISQNFRNIHKSPHTLLELPFIDSYATYNVFHYLVDNTQLYGRFVERGTLHYKFGDNWHLVHGNLESRKLVRHGSEYLDKSNVKTSFLWHTYRVPFPLTRGYKTEFIYVNPLDKPTTIKASILRYQNSDKSRKQVLIKELFQLKPREIKILDFNTVTDIYPSFLQLQSKLLVARPLIVQKNGDTITQILHS